jgi:hypothetical protein
MVIFKKIKQKNLSLVKYSPKNLLCEKYAKITIEKIFEIHAICPSK